MREYVVVIPAYRPMEELNEYVKEIIQNDVTHVVVVNDGNDESYNSLFQEMAQYERCTVLHHNSNRGKGTGLRTAFTYYLEHFSHLKGVVTADADGQHLIQDVLKVGDCLSKMDEGFVLGSRVFDRRNMPVRSLIGNTFTSKAFQVLFGTYIEDTQTGLRGITTAELSELVELRGDHFDYEMNMLIHMIKKDSRIIRVDIEAVYADEHTSQYDTYKDTVRIAGQMLREYFDFV